MIPIAAYAARIVGSPWTFLASLAAVATGFLYGWSDDWWICADRTVYLLTMWLLFLLQGAQNRDTKAIHIKLDECIRQLPGPNRAVDIERRSDKDLDSLKD